MGVMDVFSKRGKAAPDVYVYDTLPKKLRVQIVHIFEDALGDALDISIGGVSWEYLARAIAREHGLLSIPLGAPTRYGERVHRKDCLAYVLNAETALALDMVEVCCRLLDRSMRSSDHYLQMHPPVDEPLGELNARFLENGCGYQYLDGCIVRVDSQLVHSEVVQPALQLLHHKGFEGPNKEFLSAHQHFRQGRVEEAITDACKAFESTMKAICAARGWTHDSKAAAAALIKTLVDRGLVPNYSDEHLAAVSKSLLGLATVRNKNGGHGGGATPREVPHHFAAYALHLAASNILFLIECHNALP